MPVKKDYSKSPEIPEQHLDIPQANDPVEESIDQASLEAAASKKPENETSIIQAVRHFTKEEGEDEDEEEGGRSKTTFADILGGEILVRGWFQRNILYFMMVVGMLFVYISNRYSCQQAMIEQNVLADTLLDRRYKALTRSAQLKEKTRRSYIETSLEDSTLQTSTIPSFNLKVKDR